MALDVFSVPEGSAVLVCAEDPAVPTYCGSENVAIAAESTTRAEDSESTKLGDRPFGILITKPLDAGIATVASAPMEFSERAVLVGVIMMLEEIFG